MAALSIEGLEVRYGSAVALAGISLQMATGEILALLGGSGSGKTTLLRALGGFLAPSAGRILLDGQDITAMPPHRRPVNTMFQSYALFPHMNVAANIGFGLRRQGVAAAEIAARVAEMLALVRLEAFGTRRISDLSGGQQQRVALARALAPRPKLLLLDEPFSALDQGLRESTRLELVGLLRRFGTTAILVTHDQQEALATGDRLALLNRGGIVQTGTPAELYERPAERYVAEFLGAANILDAEFVGLSGDIAELRVAGHVVHARDVGALGPRTRLIALRPERLRLDHDGVDAPNRLPGMVRALSYEGASVTLVVATPAGEMRVIVPLTDGLRGVPAVGSACGVRWAEDAAILLPS